VSSFAYYAAVLDSSTMPCKPTKSYEDKGIGQLGSALVEIAVTISFGALAQRLPRSFFCADVYDPGLPM